MNEILGWIVLLLTAHWFFGNLYEAVVIVPNVLPWLVLKERAGEPLFRSKVASPVAYYVPAGVLMLVSVLALALTSLAKHAPGTSLVLTALGLVLGGLGLTAYVVPRINFELFLAPPADLARSSRLLHRWAVLNGIRLVIAGAALVLIILWLRITRHA